MTDYPNVDGIAAELVAIMGMEWSERLSNDISMSSVLRGGSPEVESGLARARERLVGLADAISSILYERERA